MIHNNSTKALAEQHFHSTPPFNICWDNLCLSFPFLISYKHFQLFTFSKIFAVMLLQLTVALCFFWVGGFPRCLLQLFLVYSYLMLFGKTRGTGKSTSENNHRAVLCLIRPLKCIIKISFPASISDSCEKLTYITAWCGKCTVWSLDSWVFNPRITQYMSTWTLQRSVQVDKYQWIQGHFKCPCIHWATFQMRLKMYQSRCAEKRRTGKDRVGHLTLWRSDEEWGRLSLLLRTRHCHQSVCLCLFLIAVHALRGKGGGVGGVNSYVSLI